MMWYVYKAYEEAKLSSDIVNTNYVEPNPINQGSDRHGQHPSNAKYCEPMECVEGWAVIADQFTSQHIQGNPQKITYIETTDL